MTYILQLYNFRVSSDLNGISDIRRSEKAVKGSKHLQANVYSPRFRDLYANHLKIPALI